MRRLVYASLLALAALSAAPRSSVLAQGIVAGEAPVEEIARDDPRRKPILDALRPAVEAELHQAVVFVVDVIRVQGDWAFATLHPRTKAGAPIDFATTGLADMAEDLDGDTTFALFERVDGRWYAIAYVIGPTDVAYADWPAHYGAPAGLFRLP